MITKSPISLVVSGQITSRLNNELTVDSIKESFIKFKELNPKNEIIISTFAKEMPDLIVDYVDEIIINKDPGEDHYKSNPWPINLIGKNQTNISRMLQTTISGLRVAKNKVTIKTRIELLPENFDFFIPWLENTLNEFTSDDSKKIGFFIEHFSGLRFSVDGVLGGIPDTFQISKTEVLMRTWETARIFWEENSEILSRKKPFPMTSEQILGMNFLSTYFNFEIKKELHKLKKYYFSMKLIKSEIKAENNSYLFMEYKKSGFSRNYFAGSYFINTNKITSLNSKVKLMFRIIYILLKQYKHIIRKYIRGIKIHFSQ